MATRLGPAGPAEKSPLHDRRLAGEELLVRLCTLGHAKAYANYSPNAQIWSWWEVAAARPFGWLQGHLAWLRQTVWCTLIGTDSGDVRRYGVLRT